MFDRRVLALSRGVLHTLASRLVARGIRADQQGAVGECAVQNILDFFRGRLTKTRSCMRGFMITQLIL